MHRDLLTKMLLSAVLITLPGCNLFDATEVGHNFAVDATDVGHNVAVDAEVPPDVELLAPDLALPDTGDCVPETEELGCSANGVSCGALTWIDNCGLQRAAICDICDSETAVCDGVSEMCVCRDGFAAADETRCLDVDECADGTDDCAADEFCVNLPGSFECSDCPAGQEKDADGTCIDLNECADGTDNCDPLVTCTNLDPFFECGPCPAGYDDTNADGTQCEDVDECADGSDDCDANALCTNQPGSFQCECNAPYIGDGRTCTLIPSNPVLVSGVSVVTISLAGTTASAALPASINDAAKVVPFATAKVIGAADELEATLVDVWVDAAAGTVQAQRGAATGTVEIEVALVEFNAANVQTGTYEMDDVTEVDVPMPTAFDPGKSFVVFGSRLTGLGSNDRNPAMARLVYDGMTVRFERRIALGSRLGGHWYAVEAEADEFSVLYLELDIGFAQRCVSTTANVDFARTMLIAAGGSPATQNGPLNNPSKGNIECHPSGGNVECCRGEPDNGQNAVSVTVFAVEFEAGSNGNVQHGTVVVNAGDTARDNALATSVDPSFSMASLGMTGLTGAMMATADLPNATQNAAFGLVKLLQNGAMLRVEIGESTTEIIEGSFQAVTWPH